ncbi:protein chibby homolog 1 isoform X2 [Panthera uncia]|uniref:protein chibby homolog 1 isoform X2 n=1 Tax=Panthera uncia TaxID=29064 RepID=UPI0020FFE7FC|nr:protein chibby homolog 1 isoform X2 [Panthera uncia]
MYRGQSSSVSDASRRLPLDTPPRRAPPYLSVVEAGAGLRVRAPVGGGASREPWSRWVTRASAGGFRQLDRSTREVELGLDYGTPTMNLAGQSLKFENGQWIAEMGISGGVDRREAQRLRRRNQQLEEENNLLRLKVDILLDMLSETTAESHLMEKELEELKSTSRRRK